MYIDQFTGWIIVLCLPTAKLAQLFLCAYRIQLHTYYAYELTLSSGGLFQIDLSLLSLSADISILIWDAYTRLKTDSSAYFTQWKKASTKKSSFESTLKEVFDICDTT